MAFEQRQLRNLIAAGAVVAGLALALWVWPDSTATTAANQQGGNATHTGSEPPFVPSQQGTIPDGALRPTKGDNSPLPYAELRRLFDYYLSALGEKDLAAITQQIQTELDTRLGAAQAVRARRLLDSYLAFRRALVDLEAKPDLSGEAFATLRKRMVAQQALRAQYFNTAEIEGMFGFEDRYDTDALARLEIAKNTSLSAAQRQQQIAALDAALPADLRAERDASAVVSTLEQQVQQLRAQGASDDDIYRMRAQAFDAGAADRLAAVDREEAAWKERISQYLSARSQLLQTLGDATPQLRDQALQTLQQSLFSAEEQRRLAAYEP